MRRLLNKLLYGGLSRESYYKIRKFASKDNRKAVRVFALLGAFSFAAAGAMAIVIKMQVPLFAYFIAAAFFILIFLINELLGKKIPILSDAFALIYSLAVLLSGVYIAYGQSDERTTMLLPLFSLVALVFCYRPIYLIFVLSFSEIVYLVALGTVQSGELYFTNVTNTVIFSVFGLIGGLYTIGVKYKRYDMEFQNALLLERDVLTGLLNRFSCQRALDNIPKIKKPVTICSFDINGLKTTNDNYGHIAGDELIIAAADCLKDVFGKYGKVYRIGGDEFFAIIYDNFDKEAAANELAEKSQAWRGSSPAKLCIAAGFSVLDHDYEEGVQKAIHEADLLMYKEKQKYHDLYD